MARTDIYMVEEVHEIGGVIPADDWFAVYFDEGDDGKPELDYSRLVAFVAGMVVDQQRQVGSGILLKEGEPSATLIPYGADGVIIDRVDDAEDNYLGVVHRDDIDERHDEFLQSAGARIESARRRREREAAR